jgi:hypothetical protein
MGESQTTLVPTRFFWERVKRLVYRKFGLSEMDISEIDTFDDVISDKSISNISIAKNGHIGLDISEI